MKAIQYMCVQYFLGQCMNTSFRGIVEQRLRQKYLKIANILKNWNTNLLIFIELNIYMKYSCIFQLDLFNKSVMSESEVNILSYLNQNCTLCFLSFDDSVHIPMMLCYNQHLACKKCLDEQLLKKKPPICPQCRIQIDPLKVTKFRRLFKVIEETKKTKIELKKSEYQFLSFCLSECSNFEEKQSPLNLRNLSLIEKQSNFTIYRKVREKQFRNLQQSILDQAVSHFRVKSMQQCIATCKIILQNNPQQLGQFLGLGSKQEQKGYYEQKVHEWFQEKFKEKRISCYDLLGLCFLIEGRFQEQLKWYLKMEEMYPENYKIMYGMAVTEHNKGNLNRAEQIYTKISQLQPNFCKPYQMLGFISLDKEYYKKAVQYVNLCLVIQKDNIFARYIKAVTNFKQEKYQDCNHIIKAINTEQPLYARAINLEGNLMLNESKHEKAIQCFDKCLKINNNFHQPRLNKGKCLNKLKKFRQSLQFLHNFQSFEKENDECLFLIGDAYFEQKNIHKAKQYLQKCMQANPLHYQVYYKLASLYKSIGQHQNAIQMYERDLKNDPQCKRTYQWIIECYQRLKNITKAIEWTEKLLKLKNEDQLYLKIAGYYFKNKDYAKSLEKYNYCLELNLSKEEIYERIVQIYGIKKNYEKQVQQLKKWMLVNPANPTIWNTVSQVFKKASKEIQNKRWTPSKDFKF